MSEPVYAAVISAARVAMRALDLRIDVLGDERVPRTGPVILAANHVSFLDFALVGLVARRSRRRVRFLARHDVWRVPGVGAAMTAMRHVPVDRAAPAAAYLRARSLLGQGEAVGVFPEAGVSRSFTVRSLMPGAVALARETGVPVLPVAIWGPQRVLTAKRPIDLGRGRPVSLLVGEPLEVQPDADLGESTAALGRRLQQQLDRLQARPRHQPRPGEDAPWHPAHLGGSAPTPQSLTDTDLLPRGAVPPARWRAP